MKILMTSGPTKELIDGVRFLTNQSSGNTGFYLKDRLSKLGYDVKLLTSTGVENPDFDSFSSLEKILISELSRVEYDFVIHLAAVSDYSVDFLEIDGKKVKPNRNFKLSSDISDFYVALKKNPKLLNTIKINSKNPNIKVIGFKLTNKSNEENVLKAVRKVFDLGNVDYVVHNDLDEISKNSHFTSIFNKNLEVISKGTDKESLVYNISKLLENSI